MSISGFVNVIYIIDILSDEDLYSNEKIEFQMSGKKISLPNNTASQLLKSIVTITSNNPVYFVKIHNIPMFMNFMEEVATNVEKKGEIPILHFECHGSKENGIYLPSIKKHIDWKILNKLFANVNKKTGNNLMLAIAGCESTGLIDNIDFKLGSPFGCFIGSNNITYDGIIKRFKDYYLHLFKYNDFKSACEIIEKDDFKVFFSEDIYTQKLLYLIVLNYFGKNKIGLREFTTSKLKQNGLRGNITEIREVAKFRLSNLKYYYELSGFRFLHGKKPLPFEQAITLAKRIKKRLDKEAKTNIKLAQTMKEKQKLKNDNMP